MAAGATRRRTGFGRNDLRRRGLPTPHISGVARVAAAGVVGPTLSGSCSSDTILQALVGGAPVGTHLHSLHALYASRSALRDGHRSLRHRCSRSQLAQVIYVCGLLLCF